MLLLNLLVQVIHREDGDVSLQLLEVGENAHVSPLKSRDGAGAGPDLTLKVTDIGRWHLMPSQSLPHTCIGRMYS